MKYFLFVIILSMVLFSKTVDCIVPYHILTKVKPLFKGTIDYSKLRVRVQTVADDQEALKQLLHKKKAKFAIVRRDILWQIEQSKSDLKQSYILISELPFEAMLYLVQSVDAFDVDLDFLEKKQVSIGRLGEFSSFYLKALLKKIHMQNSVLYRSFTYKQTIQQIIDGKIDAYFGFLLPCKESSDLHFQTLFSEQTVEYFKNKHIFNVDYNGISSPYILVSATTADDEEIESIIYRLMKKELFVPVTDERLGMINRYVLNHLEQVKEVLKRTYKMHKNETIQVSLRSKVCRKYHYGFLKLLRQKPAWKKKLKRLGNPEKRKEFIKALDTVLLNIEAEKESCNLRFLKTQKMKFKVLKEKVNNFL